MKLTALELTTVKRIVARHLRSSIGTAGSVLALLYAPTVLPQNTSPATLQRAVAEVGEHWDVLEQNCFQCHNEQDWAGEIAFDLMTPETMPADGEIWEEVVRRLRGGLMPPPGQDQPLPAERDALVLALEAVLDAAATTPQPGHVGLHRLNRNEYHNAVQDMFGLSIDTPSMLPTDAVSHGFDNIAAALRVSTTFLDQYISAARTVSIQAVGGVPATPSYQTYFAPPGDQSLRHAGMPPGTRGGVMMEHTFPTDGIYEFNIEGMSTARYVSGFDYENTVIITVDDERVFEGKIGGEDDFRAIDQRQYYALGEIEDRFRNIRVPVKAGVRKVAAAFVARTYSTSDEILESFYPLAGRERNPVVGQFSITGPFNPGAVAETESRQRIFTCRPVRGENDEVCARSILSSLARLAYRRPVSDDDLSPLMDFYHTGRERADFETGIQRGIMAILASPNFLYRTARPPLDAQSGEVFAINDIDLASRLSFFLWSSIPDDELLRSAENGELGKPEVLDAQIVRMLADPRAEHLVDGFAMQWLRVDDIEAHATPDGLRYPEFDTSLLSAFHKEMQLFLSSILLEDRSVVGLMTADHSYVNERLAKHYGLPVVMGEDFQRVTLTQPERFGILGKGAILTATSYPHRTSPVLRGAWILENLLGTPPAAPPAGVDTNLADESAGTEAANTVRAMLEQHRENPSCNSCHGVMDPLGVALENFDALGAWRERDRFAGQAIRADGRLATGAPVDGPVALREALIAEPEQFVRTVTENLLAYGLGRTLSHTDMPTVRAIARQAADHDYSFAALVRGVVNSKQFRLQQVPPADEAGEHEPSLQAMR